MTDNIRQQIYLAALLHDIGKFYQRADKRYSDKANELSDYSKKLAEDICPIDGNGRFGYQHVIWTNEFFELFKTKIEEIPGFKNNLYTESTVDNVVNFACNHHKPQSRLQAFVTLGDWWSAGIDRTEADRKPRGYGKNIDWGKNRYKEIPLYSVFNTINNGNNNSAFKLRPLSINREDIFTHHVETRQDGVDEGQYRELWDKFTNEFTQLPTDSFDGFTESLLFLLKKYTWSIPSNTMDMADVSLFEHLKTTAAFADCLYSYSLENENAFLFDDVKNRLSITEGKLPVLLVGGDISGIQKFIYNIASQKAAKSLKGRSFYLQLLTDSIIQRIATHEDIQVTPGHVIYSSGGKFYMILPNTEKVKAALTEIKNDIEKELWNKHKGKLSVNIDSIAFAFSPDSEYKIRFEGVDSERDLGDLWRALAERLNVQKNRKFFSIITEDFFKVNKVEPKAETCAVTGEELSKSDMVKLKGTDAYVSKTVNEQTELGTTLKDADYIITHRDIKKHTYLNNRAAMNIEIAGVYNYLFDQVQLVYDDADFRKISSADVSRVLKFNDTDFLRATLKGKAVSYGFRFYGGNKQAVFNQDRDKTFEELTQVNYSDDKSETYLGVLRMDVDGLGNIFIKGLSEDKKTFAAYATMSFQLDLFFSGYLNTIRNSEKYRDFVNILYSGGDDVFAVGRWDLIIDFAEDIRKEFAAFIGRNDISISGGIAIIRNKYPIAKAAEMAGDAEDASKDYSYIGEKNAITFLGETVSWNSEFNEVKELKNEFIRLIEQENMSKGILHKLMEFAGIKKENERHQKEDSNFKPDLSYKWNTAYYLKRFADRFKKNEAIKYFLLDGKQSLVTRLFTNNRSYDIVSLAARHAELELREIKKYN